MQNTTPAAQNATINQAGSIQNRVSFLDFSKSRRDRELELFLLNEKPPKENRYTPRPGCELLQVHIRSKKLNKIPTSPIMKNTLVLTILMAAPALAGTQVMTESPPPPPVTQDVWSWFVGGTGGYLLDAEEGMYTLQVGAKSPWAFGGWAVSLYAEAGWTESEEQADTIVGLIGDEDAELDIVPITFNVKLERIITGGLSAYIGGGVGASYLDAQIVSPFDDEDESANDWIFTGQVFAGLAYHVSDSFEIFGGARWIYFDSSDLAGIELGDDWLIEGGVRFHF